MDHSIDFKIFLDRSTLTEEISLGFKNFTWRFGNFEVQKQEKNLGLKLHIYHVFQQGLQYDYLVVLEDDILAGRAFLSYLENIIAFDNVADTSKIAGYSLYSPRLNETSLARFYPNVAGTNFFMQLPCSWGQVFSKNQLVKFLSFRDKISSKFPHDISSIPSNINRWSEKSWKREYFLYMLHYDLFFSYPVISFTNNVGAVGTHLNKNTDLFNVEYNYGVNLELSKFCEESAYDAYMDRIKPHELVLDGKTVFVYENFTGEKLIDEGKYQVSFFKLKKNVLSLARPSKLTDLDLYLNEVGDQLHVGIGSQLQFSLKNVIKFWNYPQKSGLAKLRRFFMMLQRCLP